MRESLLDRWRSWRNRLVADPDFQRRASRFPLTRPVARRRAQALFDLSAGFIYSQIAYACVTSGLLDRLSAGPCNIATLAARVDLDEAATLRLVKAAVTLTGADRRLRAGEYEVPSGASLRTVSRCPGSNKATTRSPPNIRSRE
jgi:demethylspheroidene O-methyltransferase